MTTPQEAIALARSVGAWKEPITADDIARIIDAARAALAAEPVAEPVLPERDTSKPAEQQGLFRKFIVRRTDGSDAPGGKHEGCEYFVLDTKHDAHAPTALAAYARACRETHLQLSADLIARYGLAQPAPAPDDLVQRLRGYLTLERTDRSAIAHPICNEAADEIERLRAENFTLAAGQCVNATGDEGGRPICLEVIRLRAENDTLRLIATKIMPCHYCGVDELGKCPHGFPGCSLADDMMCGGEPMAFEIQRLRAERDALRELLDAVRTSGISYTNKGRYHEVQISLALWAAIDAAMKDKP
jgi:hypothetical protein